MLQRELQTSYNPDPVNLEEEENREEVFTVILTSDPETPKMYKHLDLTSHTGRNLFETSLRTS